MKVRFIFLIFSALFFLFACSQNNSSSDITASGEELSKVYCVACHQYPSPDLLDKATWRDYVLPRMGYLMGVYADTTIRKELLAEVTGGSILEQANIFPEKPNIDTAILNKINAFYLANAPEQLTLPVYQKPQMGLKHFKVRIPSYRLSPPSTTLVKFSASGGFYIGDANTKGLYQFDQKLNLQKAASLKEAPVWIQEIRNFQFVTVMGSFSPTDVPSGLLYSLSDQLQIILPTLQRPVHSELADFNGDKKGDILTCEFAKWTGGLAWWENKGNAQYQKHILRNKPGATKAYVRDFNNDQKPDVIALFGQGDEGIFIYYNEGNGVFREERVVQFPAAYGSSYFNLVDFDKDGDEDIIYTAGDNADYPPVMKPYHGIRVFLNNGNNQFTESFFYHLNGAYHATARDFDNDGDLDIAAISFFPDYQNAPEQGFVYLENQGNNNFQPFTFPDVTKGRWIVMDAGDADQDGDIDLIIGSLAFEIVPANDLLNQWVQEGIPFILLENTTK
ncbi:MAG: VCBS repeat-containing protein [Saprospiraceae bacterium]|nr:VCBS repeat-containing protein [Saprospiraceae bacterium]